MENLPLKIFSNIMRFLSLNEKKRLRGVSIFFYSNISHNILITIKMEHKLSIINSIQILSSTNANLRFITETLYHYIYKNINDYMPNKHNVNNYTHGVHRYYNLTNLLKNVCVNSGCREKRAEYLYFSRKNINNNIPNTYQKKYIPYCIPCFIHCLKY